MLGEVPADAKEVAEEDAAAKDATALETFEAARDFATRTYEIVLGHNGAANTLSCVHTTMVFLHYLSKNGSAMSLVAEKYPWELTASVLNSAMDALESEPRMSQPDFPCPPENEPLRPLPEDYTLRGLRYSDGYFPGHWFSSDKLEMDEKMFEMPSLADERRQRILWLGRQIAANGKWLQWDGETRRFSSS